MCSMICEIDFRYCPKCAGVFEKKTQKLLVCKSCGLEYFVNPKPTNAVILKDVDGRVLLAKRALDPQKGKWDLPGGFIDINETVEESIHREIQEELGIRVKDLTYLSSFHNLYEYGGINFSTVCLIFEASMIDPANIKPADDVESVHFFATSEIPYDDFAFEEMRTTVQKILLY